MENEFKEDLRVKKTRLALLSTLVSLLNKRNFNKITINDLCKEAMVGRASFYSHFRDKYDLLRVMLANIRKTIVKDVRRYSELESTVNDFIQTNKKIIRNILQYANRETHSLMQEFMADILGLCIRRKTNDEDGIKNDTLSNFCTGGLIQLLLWQVENDFPSETNLLNNYVYKMIECVIEWDAGLFRNNELACPV